MMQSNTKCPTCGYSSFYSYDHELVCEHCGSAFCLQYLGMYEEGSDDRIDAGYEPKWWKDKYGKL